MSPIIRNFIAKRMFQQKGAIANNKSVEFSANALQQRIKNLGMDPNTIKSEGDLNQIFVQIKYNTILNEDTMNQITLNVSGEY